MNFFKTLCCLCLMTMCYVLANAEEATPYGDLDGDGIVNINDVTSLIDYLLSDDATIIDVSKADLDGDRGVSINDLTALIDYLLSGTQPYVPEYETFTVNGVTFRMLLVKGGTFMMGATDDDPYAKSWEKPAHEVTLSDYYIAETEVTQALWKAVMGNNNPSWFTSANGYVNDFQRPVESVTYANCLSFITKLNQKTGKTFRLPTEAEWEFAARGGNMSMGYMYAGSNNIDEVAWYKGTSGDMPHAVATKAPNELGLYDMSGNVQEWCKDFYGLYTDEAQTNPQGSFGGTSRVMRGGCWEHAFRNCRLTSRYDAIPSNGSIQYGLRLAM